MATSGSVDYNVTRDEIITQALQLLNVLGIGETASSADVSFAASRLNGMVKSWQAQGLHLWSKQEGVLLFADNVGEYDLSSASGSAKATKASDFIITQLASDGATSATSLTVDDTTGMAASDNIGIVLDAGTVHWTTIVSVDTSTTLTITSGLASAAATDNNVYTFTSRINRPLRILSCRLVRDFDTNETETPLLALSHEEFFNLPAKKRNGTPTSYYYDPQLTTGKLYLWQRPDDPSKYLKFTYERSLEDFDASGDNPDFPQEWIDALVYNLAVRIAPAFGQLQLLQVLAPLASEALESARTWDAEVEHIRITVDEDSNSW